ncbi:uncharacterized protein C3orf22 homolog [Psammomys obesus]|uniref:uncharacterized protein C3orf22 homolog n=1 Tax=Psammomys obesus TaxID=48139 RepID=UPI002452DA91|nr:uncharacterized protein C3orf22 homolog [Psammomys obesus]
MDLKGSKKTCCSKKYTAKLKMRFAKRFPYRLCWLTEPTTVPPLSWKVKRNSLKDQLPLQKKLLPTRSIPIPGGTGSKGFYQAMALPVHRHAQPVEAQEVLGICCIQLGFPRLEEQVAGGVCEPLPASPWQPLATEVAYGAGTGLAGDRTVKSLPYPGWLQPAGFPGSGVVLCDFSRAVSPDFTWPFTFSPPSRPPPRRNSWEHKLVSLRFPKQDLHKQPPPQSPDNQPKQPPPQYADNQFLTCRELQPSGHVS